MTQTEIAEVLELTRRTIGSYESGERAPKRAVVAAWAMATAVPVEWLETGKTPSPDGEGVSVVRHQGLEPRTR
nr:helix-turn-helix transcriptional regulator [Rhodococcus sp. LW-XY12]